jgi:hypothetical protein
MFGPALIPWHRVVQVAKSAIKKNMEIAADESEY